MYGSRQSNLQLYYTSVTTNNDCGTFLRLQDNKPCNFTNLSSLQRMYPMLQDYIIGGCLNESYMRTIFVSLEKILLNLEPTNNTKCILWVKSVFLFVFRIAEHVHQNVKTYYFYTLDKDSVCQDLKKFPRKFLSWILIVDLQKTAAAWGRGVWKVKLECF
ncbi:hypothetical protein CDAR_492961 [Caerostris darwini]|uniref:Uncharacterized protein n=1 Tax=Caerostris darwini TaxID=1538125 RepID=A0AAV4TD38_9ARAC|nr:hypothetical protein CDAR_492961 [Caerostris darwini]